MKKLGLIGYPLSHSFSKGYFAEKFKKENIPNHRYDNYAIPTIADFPNLLASQTTLVGLNVTIPYKEQVIPYLDSLDSKAAAIGAVNTIRIADGKTKGFNTDIDGFEYSLRTLLGEAITSPLRALVLGTGGAAKAVHYVLQQLGIVFQTVSRHADKGDLTYEQLNAASMTAHRLIVNTTPLGMSPHVERAPDLPYEQLGTQHFLYDLIYNPAETRFLERGRLAGAKTTNGLEMLHIQAERAWEIWNTKNAGNQLEI